MTDPTPTAAPAPAPAPAPARNAILLRAPSIYATSTASSAWRPPPLEWLARTWSVTHSTLPMWRKARNVRITYRLLEGEGAGGGGGGGKGVLIDDEVCSEPTKWSWMPQPKTIRGIDTPIPGLEAAWIWRGRGLMKIASSHWEVLGWGEDEEGGEKWVVTWFQASLFTPMGVDVYSDRKEGVSEALFGRIQRALEDSGAGEEVGRQCKEGMFAVEIKY